MPFADNSRHRRLIRSGWFLIALLNHAQAQETLTASELQGRQLYRRGDPLAMVEVGGSETKVNGTLFPCANCHGNRGEGNREAGVEIPAISASALFVDSGVRRRYDLESLKRAITQGLDPNRRSLDLAMPRYHFTGEQLVRLLAYLQRLGTDRDWDPGIDGAEVRLGTLLPLSGAMADTGQLLKATLEACLTELNGRGAIYGRKLSLTVLDSGTNDPEARLARQNSLLEDQVFTIVSPYLPAWSAAMYRRIEQENLPVIAPLALTSGDASLSMTSFFNFLPTYDDQLAALIEYWLGSVTPKTDATILKLAVVVGDNLQNRALLPKIRSDLKRHPRIELTQTIELHANNQTSALVSSLGKLQIDGLLFLGNAQEFNSLRPVLADKKNQPVVLSSLEMLGGKAVESADFSLERLLLATPFALSNDRLERFRAKLSRQGVELLNPGLQNVACKAVELVHQGLKQVGKQLSRSAFIDALRQGNSLDMDFMPALEFVHGSPHGIRGSYILDIDNKAGHSRRSEWVSVR